jgi:uncharacterized membrane protein YkoI
MTRAPRSRPRLAALLLGAALAAVAVPASAADRTDVELVRKLVDAGEIVPFGVILNHTRERHPGRVIKVKFEEDGEQYRYEVEVLDGEGVVWALFFDARTGDLIETMQESTEIHQDKDEVRA